MSAQLHANQVGPDASKRFREMIDWLRSPEGPNLSWGQIARSGKLPKVLGEGNPQQVMQDLSRSRAPAVAVYDALVAVFNYHKDLARNGEYGVVAAEKVTRPDPASATYRQRILDFLRESGGSVPVVGDIYRGAKGSQIELKKALAFLVESGKVDVYTGPWPPLRGQRTGLRLSDHEQSVAPTLSAKQTTSPDLTATVTPTLASARTHVQRAVYVLHALAARPPKNIPLAVQELVVGQYLTTAEELERIVDELREEEETS